MSKITLSNFKIPAAEVLTRTASGTDFEITTHIPYEDLLTHIQWAIILITDSNGYISEPVKIACKELVMCAAFTNLDLSRLELAAIEQKELYEIYDIVKKCGIINIVKENIDLDQLSFYEETLSKTLDSIMNYRNSIAGIVELLSSQSEELKNHLSNALEDFNDPTKTENVIRIAELMKSQVKE